MWTRDRWVSFAIALALGACATRDREVTLKGSPASHDAGGSSARDALFAADADLADSIARLGPIDGPLAPMRDDAIYLAEGIAVVRGKDGISSELRKSNATRPAPMISRTLAGGDASADGRFGFTFGWSQASSREGGDATPSYATYVTAWTRDGASRPFRVAAYYTRASSGPHPPARDGFPLLVGGSGASGVPHPAPVEEQKQSLLRIDAEFAAYSIAHGYTLAFATYAAEVTMPFGRNFAFLVGRQEVLEFYKGWTPAEVLEWTPLFAEASESGDLGYTVGTSVMTTTKPDGSVQRVYNKYLSIWARRADGSWKYVADGGASAPAPSPGPYISEGLSRVQTKPPKRPGAVE
jgi:ketosteroid isomerase-like protein